MFEYLKTLFAANLPRSEKGQDLAEYALLIALIALVVVAALMILGPQISTLFVNISNYLGGVPIP